MMEQPTIAAAEVADAARVLDLQKLAYQSEARLYNDWSIPPLTQTLASILKEFESKTFLKATLGDSIVGSVRAVYRNNICEIGRLIVHPDFRRRSIGTHLMQAIEALFPQAERFELFTGERSLDNIRLYSRLGYRVTRSEPLSPAVTLIYMEKRRQSVAP